MRRLLPGADLGRDLLGRAEPHAPRDEALGHAQRRPVEPRRDLRVSLSGGEGAAGSTYFDLTLTNTSKHPCRTGGFGGVSLVGDGNGTQIGAPADRTQTVKVRAITLQPGGKATATLRETNAENYPATKCRPAPAEGFRVYPPNETHAAYVAHGSTGCRNEKVHLLSLAPYQSAG